MGLYVYIGPSFHSLLNRRGHARFPDAGNFDPFLDELSSSCLIVDLVSDGSVEDGLHFTGYAW